MDTRTLKTVLGYLRSLTEKWTGLSFKSKKLKGIYNHHIIRDGLHTSGQPTKAQIKTIADHGFKTIINLAPSAAENSLKDERRVVEEQGISYIHLPVDFKRPTDEDFEHFCTLMEQHKGQPLWVHCAANMRVSTFVYRYRVAIENEDSEVAKKDMDKIWQPFGIWKKFVAKALAN